MSHSKTFHTGDVITAVTGRLVSPNGIGGVYEILNWVTGDDLMTHQLPRAFRECEAYMRDQFPDLAAIDIPDDLRGEPDVLAWLDRVVAEHGETREVEPMAVENHTRIDPFSELKMLRPDAEIIAIEIPRDE